MATRAARGHTATHAHAFIKRRKKLINGSGRTRTEFIHRTTQHNYDSDTLTTVAMSSLVYFKELDEIYYLHHNILHQPEGWADGRPYQYKMSTFSGANHRLIQKISTHDILYFALFHRNECHIKFNNKVMLLNANFRYNTTNFLQLPIWQSGWTRFEVVAVLKLCTWRL